MLLFSENELHKSLCDINLYKKNLKTTYDLIKYVWTNADNKKYSHKDVLNLIDVIQKNPLLGLSIFKEVLSKKSTGDLHSFIENIDFSKDNIFTYTNLIKHLLKNSIYHNYTPSVVYDILINILDINDIQFFIKELERVGPEAFSFAFKNIDLKTISNINELIQTLLGMSEEYNFNEDDVINAIIRLICEKGINNLKGKSEGWGFETYAIPGLAIASIILFLIILYLRKKKNEKKKQQ